MCFLDRLAISLYVVFVVVIVVMCYVTLIFSRYDQEIIKSSTTKKSKHMNVVISFFLRYNEMIKMDACCRKENDTNQ